MTAKYANGSYYLNTLGAILKLTQVAGTLITEIEIVETMPEHGDELDPNDVLVQALLDNLQNFVSILRVP
jgi:hypothetical protein